MYLNCSEPCTHYYLLNPDDWFEAACQLKKTQQWLEKQARRGRKAYLVTAFRTLYQADVSSEKSFSLEGGGKAPLPSALDSSVEAKMDIAAAKKLGFKVPGEKVFAIYFREVKLAKHTCEATAPELQSKIRWEQIAGFIDANAASIIIAANLIDVDPSPCYTVVDPGEEQTFIVEDSADVNNKNH